MKVDGDVSIILPAKNEAPSLARLLPALREAYPQAEVLVVDDGSSDETANLCEAHGVRCVRRPYSMGNGAAVKLGAAAARGSVLVFLDADGQHDPRDIPQLLQPLEKGYDMVVGARTPDSHASPGRRLANGLYNGLASWITGRAIRDLTSGFRTVRAAKFRQFLFMLPNGFSYPTTCTMAFFRSGYPVAYVPIRAERREGRSHLNVLRDGVRFLLIIFRITTLYSPLKLFFPLAAMTFLVSVGYYLYTYATIGRFTNMGALLFITSVVIFLMGLLSEQITMLVYQRTHADEDSG